jgi:putative copper resistance protein D
MTSLADIIALAFRGLSFVADLQAAGIALFLVLFCDALSNSENRIRRLGLVSALAGLVFTGTHYLLEAARLDGQLAGVMDASLQTMLLETNIATAAVTRVLGLIIISWGLFLANRRGDVAGLIGAMLVIISFTLVGHTSSHDLRWLLIGLLITHMIVLTLWFGALIPLWLVSRHETVKATATIVREFSAIASWSVPLILIAGLGMMVVLLGGWPILWPIFWMGLWTNYGISLLVKISLFVVLMGLAALNKWRLGPAIDAGNMNALSRFRRSICAEWCLIASVLLVTAIMTGLFSPTH